MLDINKAKFNLGWTPRMNLKQCISLTVDWYRNYEYKSVYELCSTQILEYISHDNK